MFLGDRRQICIIFSIFLSIHSVLSICEGSSLVFSQQREEVDRSYNLNIAYMMNNPEITFTRLVVLSKQWDKLFLNLSVQNYGEAIDFIQTSSKINDLSTDHSFSSKERDGLKNCLVYQFDRPQTLIIPLNYTYQETLSISISIYLDALISWREVEYNFKIFSASLYAINLVQPLTEQPLLITSKNFHFILQSSQISYFGERLLLRSYLPVQIPDNQLLTTNLELEIIGGKFDYLSLTTGQSSKYLIEDNIAVINTTINQDDLKDHVWYIDIHIIPIIDSHDGYSDITFTLQVHGVLKEKLISNNNLDLIDHPIPGIIMTPLLIFVLFGIPYYYVYQEELTEKDDQILESELGRL